MMLMAIVGLGGIAIFFSILIALASAEFRVQENPRLDRITEILPGLNCGACGFANCKAFAEAVIDGKAPADGCKVRGTKTAEQISVAIGKKTKKSEKYVAHVYCSSNMSSNSVLEGFL
jgi:Na+-translocating ferredoxin:NAD+ oxidoreductase RNF subunit RnfB